MDSTNEIWSILAELDKREGISEFIINDSQHLFVEHQGELVRLNRKVSAHSINEFVSEIIKNLPDSLKNLPLIDSTLSDGSRINIVMPPLVENTPAITIRRFKKTLKKFQEDPAFFQLTPEWIRFLQGIIKARLNILIAGGTSSGKTTFLNMCLQEIDPIQRIVSIEDTKELNIQHQNIVRLISSFHHQSQVSMRELVRNTLRMRPDRIIIGEVRGAEVFDLLQAMNTGHQGSMTTIHANSTSEALSRLENLYLLSGFEIPIKVLRYQVSTALDFIIHLRRDHEGKRVISQVTEIAGMEQDKILLQDVGRWRNGMLEFTGLVPKSFAKLQDVGIPADFFTKV